MRLVVVGPGLSLGLRMGQVEVRRGRELVERVPLSEVDVIVVSSSSASVSARLLYEAGRSGVPLYLADPRGDLVSVVLPGTPTRTADKYIAQAEWRLNPGLRLRAAKWFVKGKIRGRVWLLKRLSRGYGLELRDAAWGLEAYYARVVEASSIDELRLLEAEAGRRYWASIIEYTVLGEKGFRARIPRGGDEWNTALDYAYGLLRGVCHRSLWLAGLYPYMGFMHVEKSGRPSLTLDFMEPYRWLAEWTVLKYAARKDVVLEPDGSLSRETRSGLLKAWFKMEESRYPGSRYDVRGVIVRDAWRLASALVDGGDWSALPPEGW